MEFHDVFEHIGEIGLYQLLVYFSLGALNIMNGIHALSPNFFYAPMDHWCQVSRLQNYSYEIQKHVAIPYEEGGGGDELQYDSCVMFDLDYDSLTEEQILNWDRNDTIGVDKIDCSNGWVYDRWQFESTIISKYDLVCGKSWMAELTSSLYMAGVMIGGLLSGAMADRFGRKPCLMVAIAGYFTFAFLQAFAPNYTAFVIFRFLNGFSNMNGYLCSFVIVMEIIGPKYSTMLGILYQIFFSVGIMLVAAYGYAIRDVQKFFIVAAAPIFLMLAYGWTVPESPRWQVAKGRYKEAEATLKFIAKVNGRTFPDDVTWTVNKKTDVKKGTCSDLCQSRTLVKELAIMYLNWFTVTLVYYGVSFNAGSFGPVFLNTFLSGVIEVPANILCWLALAYSGRRWSNGAALIMTGLFCLACVPVILVRPDMQGALTALSTLGKGAIAFAFSSIYLYSAELFPTPVRQLALGTASMFGRVGSMASPYIGRTLEEVWKPLPSVIFGGVSMFTGIMVFFLPETRGWPLPDTIEEAENIAKKIRPRTRAEKLSESDSDDTTRVVYKAADPTVDADGAHVSLGEESAEYRVVNDKSSSEKDGDANRVLL